MTRNSDMFLAGGFAFIVLLLLAFLVVFILFLLNLQRTLEQVQPQNRDVPPTNVWLMLIPLFNVIYPFILYPRISQSVSREYSERGMPADGNFGRNLGIAMPIVSLSGLLFGGLSSIAHLVLMIIFWAKMAKYKTALQMNPIGEVRLSINEELID